LKIDVVLSLRYGGGKRIDDDPGPRGGTHMAIWRSDLAKTAVGTAATLVAAGKAEDFDETRDAVFAYLEEYAVKDDEAYASTNGNGSSDRDSKRSSKTASKSKSKSKGGSKGKGGKAPTLEQARSMDLTFGLFEGVTLGDLVDIGVDEANDDYEYGDGERDGRDYLAWLASDRNPNEFARARARVVAEDEGIEYDD
jgi:hypothetical protein